MANKHNIDGAGGIQVTLSQQEAKQFLLLLRELSDNFAGDSVLLKQPAVIMVRCCRGIWLAFKKLIVRCLVNRARMQKNHLLCCRKCNGEKYMSKKEILQNNFAS